MAGTFQEYKRNWEQFADSDPLWAILTDSSKRNGGWNIDEFLATGEREITRIFAELAECGVTVPRDRALDFGCGVGRLSRALASRFSRVTGVDISEGMVRQASEVNADIPGAEFVVNSRTDLTQFEDGTFDFIYSNITLQHVPPVYSTRYIAEFVRVLKPGGAAVFQVPSENDASWVGLLCRYLPMPLLNVLRRVRYRKGPVMEMHAVPRRQVEAIVADAGGEVVHVAADHAAGQGWIGWKYFVRRPA